MLELVEESPIAIREIDDGVITNRIKERFSFLIDALLEDMTEHQNAHNKRRTIIMKELLWLRDNG